MLDPNIQRLATEGKADIFTTDVALAALMSAPKAQFAWDVLIRKVDGLLFIDKRAEENMLDWQTISETAQPEFQATDDETVNGTRQLMAEATLLNKSFINAARKKDSAPVPMSANDKQDPHLEVESQIINRVGYVYKLWKTKKVPTKRIVVRCSIHSYNASN